MTRIQLSGITQLSSKYFVRAKPYTMTQKRKQAPFATEGPIYNAKRPRASSMEGSEERPGALQPRVDPTYGQRGAFPGLDEMKEHSLFYGPANDGLEYLRMVR